MIDDLNYQLSSKFSEPCIIKEHFTRAIELRINRRGLHMYLNLNEKKQGMLRFQNMLRWGLHMYLNLNEKKQGRLRFQNMDVNVKIYCARNGIWNLEIFVHKFSKQFPVVTNASFSLWLITTEDNSFCNLWKTIKQPPNMSCPMITKKKRKTPLRYG